MLCEGSQHAQLLSCTIWVSTHAMYQLPQISK